MITKKNLKRVIALALIMIFVFSFDIPDVQAASKLIPKKAVTYGGHSYKIYHDADTWEQAKAKCKKRGGYLAIIDNKKENKFLYKYMKKMGIKSVYFGLTDSKQEGVWKTSKGKKPKYTNWAKGEPNSQNYNENYAMFYYKYNDGKWNDGDFAYGNGTTDSNAYICEWDVSVLTIKKAKTYKGHSYRIFHDADTWEQAKAKCEKRGGYLAIINNSRENRFLFNFMQKKGLDSVYFGLTDSGHEGVWKTSKGKRTKYTNWSPGEPNSQNTNENYAMFYYKFSDGKWNDGDFSYGNGETDSNAYICEWDITVE